MNWYLSVLKNYAGFSGRARRTEYWMFVLINALISIALYLVDYFVFEMSILSIIYSLAVLVPTLAVSVRRLHDTGRSGWWLLLSIVPLVNLVLVVFYVLEGTPGQNQHGPNPKQVAAYA